MRRHLSSSLLIFLSLVTAMLASGITAQYLLLKEARLQQYAQINSMLASELGQMVSQQLQSGMSLSEATKQSARITALAHRQHLVSLLVIADVAGKPLFTFDDHETSSHPVPDLQQSIIRGRWQPLTMPIGQPIEVRQLYEKNMLYVSVPIRVESEPEQGTVVIGLASPISIHDFLFGQLSPVPASLAMLYLAGIVATLVLAWFFRRRPGRKTPSLTPTLDTAIVQLEQAHEQLRGLSEYRSQ